MSMRGKANWIAGVLLLLLTLPALGQSVDGSDTGGTGARFAAVSRRGRYHAKAKAAPAVSRAQMELALEMVSDSYAMGKRLQGSGVATLRPNVSQSSASK
jgi:hypothetical protein